MFRKNSFIAVLLLIVVSSFAISAQDVTITGKVQLQKEDKTREPVVGAKVVCFNLSQFQGGEDVGCGEVVTDAEGKFTISGVKPDGKFILAASSAGVGPRITLPVKAGKDEIITVEIGDGTVLTKYEVWNAYANGGDTSDQKKAKIAYDALAAELAEKQKKSEAETAKLNDYLKAGNEAYSKGIADAKAKNYATAIENFDTAIVQYDTGIRISNGALNSAPVFLNNSAAALKARAVAVFNSASTTSNPDQAKESSKKDLVLALDNAYQSYLILTAASASDSRDEKSFKSNSYNAAEFARDAIRLMVLTGQVDESKTDIAQKLSEYFVKLEKDKTKQLDALNRLGDYLMAANKNADAVAAFRKSLSISSENEDSFAGIGLVLYNLAYESEDAGNLAASKRQKQESLNYIDHFLKVAAKGHKYYQAMTDMRTELTTVDKLRPQKISL